MGLGAPQSTVNLCVYTVLKPFCRSSSKEISPLLLLNPVTFVKSIIDTRLPLANYEQAHVETLEGSPASSGLNFSYFSDWLWICTASGGI